MFTGIVKELGIVKEVKENGEGKIFKIECKKSLNGIKLGMSIALDGVCLTVTEFDNSSFSSYASSQTIGLTTLSTLKKGDFVNLEPALKADDTFSGHFVQGHIEGVGKVVSLNKNKNDHLLKIRVPKNLMECVVEKGSIAISGVSLTVSEIQGDVLSIVLIPFTLKNTTLLKLKRGNSVNIETDILVRSVQSLLKKQSNLTIEKLIEEDF